MKSKSFSLPATAPSPASAVATLTVKKTKKQNLKKHFFLFPKKKYLNTLKFSGKIYPEISAKIC